MGQDSQSGSESNAWGRAAGPQAAKKLGATDISHNSNECTLGGTRVVIKTSRHASVAVSHKMLGRIQSVIGAFQLPEGRFELFSLSAEQYLARSSSGASTLVHAKVSKRAFEEDGKHLGHVAIRIDEV